MDKRVRVLVISILVVIVCATLLASCDINIDENGNTIYDCGTNNFIIVGVYDFCKQHKFKPFYVRSWKKNEKWCYDVGSYTEFFVWADENDMEVKDDANH